MSDSTPQSTGRTILPGITLDAAGQAHVAQELSEPLFDLALAVDDRSRYPVDVQHVLAALILAAQQGRLAANTRLDPSDSQLIDVVESQLGRIFGELDGRLGADD